jgi:sugar-specific transcriptional regulator TrmB
MTDEFFNRFRHVLKPLGLSEYEIRVFLTLVRNGPANYRVLGKKSEVPLGKIYHVLSSLEAKGFVEVIREKPKIYKAVEPKKALRRSLRRLEDDCYELEWKIREVLPTLQFHYSSRHDGIRGVVDEILVGRNSLVRNVRESLSTALDEVLISVSKFDVKRREEDLFKQLLERGVTVKVICSKVDEKTKDALNRLIDLGLDVRVFDALVDEYYVVDDNFALTFIGRFGEDICLKVRGSILCRVLRERFEEVWEKARVVRQRTNNRRNMRMMNSHGSTFINSLRFRMSHKPKLS